VTRLNHIRGAGKRRGDNRANALWGRSGRSAAVCVLVVALSFPAAGLARGQAQSGAFVPQSLLGVAGAYPEREFRVIVQGAPGKDSEAVSDQVRSEEAKNPGQEQGVLDEFKIISGVSAELEGNQILKLAQEPGILAITPDAQVVTSGLPPYNGQMWPQTSTVDQLWGGSDGSRAPAIAIVDSGIDASKVADFGARIVASVNLSSLSPGATGDQQGHGTMVAGIAAGASASYPGAAKDAPLIDVRTADANGLSLTSDVIAAVDWIVAHKVQYNIRVANFSMTGVSETSFRFDPLDKAVEKLWFNGIVVVASSGNYGSATGAVDVSHAPGNDPFIITVGATDQNQTAITADDTVPWWSAYGHTVDGFAKPEISAPGRYLIMPVPADSTIARFLPERAVVPGYMWMSGTSFAAPVVAGAAAQILALHPTWTPDQVKGALMLKAKYLPLAGFSGGVGEIDAEGASEVISPPNPNENLNAFVVTDPVTGTRTFDQASWVAAVSTNPSWSSASWGSASWSGASWGAASWGSASWSSASWGTASWGSASWGSASWGSASWGSASWGTAIWAALGLLP
jgi:serine protease AprX